MEPATLGLAAAGLIASKALDKLGDRLGEEAADGAGRLRDRLADWLRRNDSDGERSQALIIAEAAPDSQLSVQRLADAIKAAAEQDPDGAAKIAALVHELQPDTAPGAVSFTTNVSGNAQVRDISNVAGDLHKHG